MGYHSCGLGEVDTPKASEVVIPEGWNSSDAYHFRYRYRDEKLYIIKCLSLGEKFLVHALDPKNNVFYFEFNLADFIGSNLENYETVYKDLDTLISLLKINILNKLNPPTPQEKERERPSPLREEEGYAYNPYYGTRSEGERYYPGGFGIGGEDLFPPSPFQPGFVDPYRGEGGPGSLVGPNHPGFGPVNDPFRGRGPFPGRGRGGLAPPGARFDPFGPPGSNFPFGPDPNHFPPPGGNFGGGII